MQSLKNIKNVFNIYGIGKYFTVLRQNWFFSGDEYGVKQWEV